MYNYNSSINSSLNNNTTNNKKENNEMNEIRVANILSKLDAQGVKISFGDQVPVSLAHSDKPYATGFMTGNVPANMTQKMFANGAVSGLGLIIEGRDETMTPELIELTCYISQQPREAASLIRFCKNCLLAGNKPVRILEDGTEKYFLCFNGKILVRNGDEFTVYYEGTELPNMDGMSDRQRISILHATKETYNNLIGNERDEDENEEEKREDSIEALITEIKQDLNNFNRDFRDYVEALIANVERAEHNDNVIQKEALVTLKNYLKKCIHRAACEKSVDSWAKEHQNRKKEDVQNDDWNF